MAKLILLRHLKSEWNLENKFTGWTDVSLSEEGINNAESVAESLKGIDIDIVYTSPLKRNRNTVSLILNLLDKNDLPVMVDESLNERHYGDLQGLNKDKVKEEYGEEQVQQWRRGWDQAPPGGESLKDVFNRVVPYYENNIKTDLKSGKNVLIVASHNSLRALVKYLENIPDDEIISLEIPTGTKREYEINI